VKSQSETAFQILSEVTVQLLLQSDRRRDAAYNPNSSTNEEVSTTQPTSGSSATNWIDEQMTFVLQQTLEKITFPNTYTPDQDISSTFHPISRIERDIAQMWIRWFKASPEPMIMDLSPEIRRVAHNFLQVALDSEFSNQMKEEKERKQKALLQRIGGRIYFVPSGSELYGSLLESTGAIVFGKLLYGGMTRYRLLPTSMKSSNRPSNDNSDTREARIQKQKRVGEKTVVSYSGFDKTPVWIQYGGMERKYQALDMGPACVLEIFLFPLGKDMDSSTVTSTTLNQKGETLETSNMVLQHMKWNPHQMFHFLPETNTITTSTQNQTLGIQNFSPAALSGQDRNDAFMSDFTSAVGGLRPQIESIVLRWTHHPSCR